MPITTRAPNKLFILTTAADMDLVDIYVHTARVWDLDQAETYHRFLYDQFVVLSDDPSAGLPVKGRLGLRMYIARVNRRRSTQGHRIIYREIEGGVRSIRILHTSMDWRRRI